MSIVFFLLLHQEHSTFCGNEGCIWFDQKHRLVTVVLRSFAWICGWKLNYLLRTVCKFVCRPCNVDTISCSRQRSTIRVNFIRIRIYFSHGWNCLASQWISFRVTLALKATFAMRLGHNSKSCHQPMFVVSSELCMRINCQKIFHYQRVMKFCLWICSNSNYFSVFLALGTFSSFFARLFIQKNLSLFQVHNVTLWLRCFLRRNLQTFSPDVTSLLFRRTGSKCVMWCLDNDQREWWAPSKLHPISCAHVSTAFYPPVRLSEVCVSHCLECSKNRGAVFRTPEVWWKMKAAVRVVLGHWSACKCLFFLCLYKWT